MNTFLIILVLVLAFILLAIYFIKKNKIKDDNGNLIPDVIEDTIEETKIKIDKTKKFIKAKKQNIETAIEESKDVADAIKEVITQSKDVVDALKGKPVKKTNQPRKKTNKK
jgi:ribosome maturation protein Sdo1